MKTLLISILLLFAVFASKAQLYERKVGVRLGYATGIFYDKQIDDLSSYRFMMSFRGNGRHFTAMKYFQKYKLDQLPENFSFYYGYGAHAGFVRWYENVEVENVGNLTELRSGPVLGLDALIGISYDFQKLPISLTADVKPFFDVLGKRGFHSTVYDLSIGAVYCF